MAKLERLYFLIHPFCYVQPRLDRFEPCMWDKLVGREQTVASRWRKAIETMGPNEGLFIYPISDSESTLELKELAAKKLADRFISFDRTLRKEQGSNYFHGLPETFAGEVGSEYLEALSILGADADWRDLKIVAMSRTLANDILAALRERQISYDPQSIRCEAWGESFEGCVHRWTGMLSNYLGFANPIEKNYEMTVPDGVFLTDTTFVERVDLADDVRLFLWLRPDNRPVGMYSKARIRLVEPPLLARICSPANRFEVRGKDLGRQVIWPVADQQQDPFACPDGDEFKVLVHCARYGPRGRAYYLLGQGIDLAEFREVLAAARFSTPFS
ncbi:MAG: hypothetical protein GWP14_09995 [Actinobacteria bacterium]|nr:hypothetical protein [Actinomycetota bacterium]